MLDNNKILDYKNSVTKLISDKKSKNTSMLDISVFYLYTGMADKARGILTLASSKNYGSIQILQRSFLEQAAIVKFLLANNQEKRGAAYMYGSRSEEIRNIKNLHDEFSDKEQADKVLEDIKSKFSKEGYSSYDEWANDMNNKYHELFVPGANTSRWYDIDGNCKSVYEMFSQVGMLDEYRLYYGKFSASTHGSDIMQHLSLGNEEVIAGYHYNNDKTMEYLQKYLDEDKKIIFDYYSSK